MSTKEENKRLTDSKYRYDYENIPPNEKRLIDRKRQRIKDLQIGLQINTVQCYNSNYCFKRKGFESCLIKIFHSVNIRKILVNCLLLTHTQLQEYNKVLEKNGASSHADLWIIIPQNKQNKLVVKQILNKWASVCSTRGSIYLVK